MLKGRAPPAHAKNMIRCLTGDPVRDEVMVVPKKKLVMCSDDTETFGVLLTELCKIILLTNKLGDFLTKLFYCYTVTCAFFLSLQLYVCMSSHFSTTEGQTNRIMNVESRLKNILNSDDHIRKQPKPISVAFF